MSTEKFSAIMGVLVPQIIAIISTRTGCDEQTAIRSFYSSKVYALLEQEDTKLWHFSPLTLYEMYDEEMRTGVFEIPVEG